MDGGAWQATVPGVAQSWTRPSDFTFTFTAICRLQVLVVLGQKIRSLPHGPLPHGCSQQSSSISQSSPLALRETERWRGAGGQRGRARQMPESLWNRTAQSASQNVGYVPSARSASPSSAHSREGITEGHKRQGSPWEPV